MNRNGENSDVISENLFKVSKKKRKRNKSKIVVNSVEIVDVKFKNIFNIDLNKNLNGKVRKLIFNLVILLKMLVLVSEFNIDSFIEKRIEFRKMKKCKEMKINEEGDMEKVKKIIKIYKEIEFEEENKVEEVRKKKKKRKEIKVDGEVDFEKVFLKFFFLKERLME